MSLEAVYSILNKTGYPVAYSHFKGKVTPPFITYVTSDSLNYFADNTVYKKCRNIKIELYTAEKNLEAENKLELLLLENELPFEVSEEWIDTEKVFQRIYEIQILQDF